jgi:hypothetical protein
LASASGGDHLAPGRIQTDHQPVRVGGGGAVDVPAVTGTDVDRYRRIASDLLRAKGGELLSSNDLHGRKR